MRSVVIDFYCHNCDCKWIVTGRVDRDGIVELDHDDDRNCPECGQDVSDL